MCVCVYEGKYATKKADVNITVKERCIVKKTRTVQNKKYIKETRARFTSY